jgi:predicted dehydrogenase
VNRRLRVGVVGAGMVLERYHVPAINAVPEVVRSIILDTDAERARHAAERFGFPKWSSNLADIAQSAELALVLVPNGLHAAVSCELLAQGVHVLCEKPMARNVDECLRMIEASRRGQVQLCVGHNRRFRQHVRLARQFVAQGLIGEIVNILSEEGSPNDWPRSPCYFNPVQSGGGALMDVGIHSIDMIRWIVGEFEDVKYRGDTSPGTVESEAEMSFRLSSGASGTIVVSRNRNLAQRMTLIGSSGFLEIGLWDPSLRIRSEKGKAFQNFPHLDIAVSRRPPQDASFVEQLRNFAEAIRGREELLVNGREGMANVEVVCRAYAAGTSSAFSAADVARTTS